MSEGLSGSDSTNREVDEPRGEAMEIETATEAALPDNVVPGFDYAALDPDIASEAKVAAERIRVVLSHTTAGIIAAGEQLKAIKDKLPHGRFTPWLIAEFGMSDRTARLYMNAAEWAAGKTEIVSVLQPTTVYALAAPSTPDTVKVGLLERLENSEAITDTEVKQLIAIAKAEKREAGEAKTRAEVEGKFAGRITGKPAPINTDHEPAAPEVQVVTHSEVEPLAAAIHAVETLSEDDRAVFDRWYHDTHQVAPVREVIDGDTVLYDDPDQSTLALEEAPKQDGVEVGEVIEDDTVSPDDDPEKALTSPERVPEPDVVEVEEDPIITMWLDLKPNSQQGGRAWVLSGAPAVVPWQEHHIIAERLKPLREAYGIAPPERQETIRRWLEMQRL